MVVTPPPLGLIRLALIPDCHEGCGKPPLQTPFPSMLKQLLTPPPPPEMPIAVCAVAHALFDLLR